MDYKRLGLLFSSIILPIILFIVSPWWGSLFTDKKELSYKTLSKRDLYTSSSLSEQWPDIKISYLGKDVSKGSFLTLAIINTGKIPIKSEDFEHPITIHLSDSASVISAKVVELNPKNLDVKIHSTPNGLSIEKLLLNPDDGFTIQIFSSAPLQILDVTTRASGLPKLIELLPEDRSGFYVKYSSVLDIGKTLEQNIFVIPLPVAILLTLILQIAFLFNLWNFFLSTTKLSKVVYLCLSAALYLLTLSGFKMTLIYIRDYNDSNKFVLIALFITGISLAAWLAVILRKRLNLT
ncbi:hypothetical protein YA0001_05955 [Pseudomonas viridiflava]|uniref:hypothetical protein n=1 Tax=Pseudomonas viridiflava TaxID=33069 RepID=UPI0018E5B1CF|nr:hypothetical protein [Pseudomonas viridiflava]MBI6575925.1 hypothetical protein [Pseudomonas viridiflava]MBI6607002.1 hypothetical protein [Pseudomonas viridiflava]MBI6638795.1 hypothetical protein [Pseudomonas viridiflava]MBI6867112.1 hypothetical protein [Pseudomonas viridiflava]MEE4068902.1 hypothetical protein [Pseudomonas viridiflava]